MQKRPHRMQKVIISILHYNNDKDTLECLNSLLQLRVEGFEVDTFVLDNGSSKALKIDVSRYDAINLQVLHSPTNTGFSGGHNLIYEKVQDRQFDYLMPLNNDSTLKYDCLVEMLDTITKEGIGAVVPKIYFTKGREFHRDKYNEQEKGTVFWYAGGYMDWDNVMSRHRGVDEIDKGQYDKVQEVDFATGACILIKKSVLKKVGLFDERYFLYYEDADLSQRILQAGFKLVYQPKSVVWHNNAGSSGSGSELHDYYLTRNRMLFGMKHAPLIIRAHLIKESLRLIISGRKWQKMGIKDYYLRRFGKGSFVTG